MSSSIQQLKIYLFLCLSASCLFAQAKEIRYSDFGAKGDGKTNDFIALKKAHEHANKLGVPVKADNNATYYISETKGIISIKTDTDFGSASFIIDDSKVKNSSSSIFEVISKHKNIRLKSVKKLKKNSTHLSAQLPSDCLIIVTDDTVKRFIRRGKNKNSGNSQADVFLVDKQGKIDVKTPIVWNFDQISKLVAYPLDKNILKIKGGTFTTIAHSQKSKKYVHRGIDIKRSNVVVEGLKHLIKNQGEEGPPYRGFINIVNCANVTLLNTIFSGHKYYYKIGSSGLRVPMGSYDLSISNSVNISLLNCTQANDIMDLKLWGIMGTNGCKNILLDNCKLSRFDAHRGVTNVTIRNSTLGYMGIKLTGFGKALFENTTVKSYSFINLRPDYGSTWNGEIKIQNCHFVPRKRRGNEIPIINGGNDGQHNFGYTTYLPQKITIDNLTIDDTKHGKDYKGPVIFGEINSKMKNIDYKQPHAQVLPKLISFKNIKTTSEKPLQISTNKFMFKDVEYVNGDKR